jgi:energy-coupling factor transporter ATP-binding protein EcfA2
MKKFKSNSDINQKGIYLHASSVNINGNVLLFLGHSSSGKSTISRLLSKRYPIIADDKVWIYQTKNCKWLVRDGNIRLNSNGKNLKSSDSYKKYPLFAILRIHKSDIIKIQRISAKTTCRHLIDAVFEVDIQRNQKDLMVRKEWFKLVADISKKNEGWDLTFKKDLSIINLIDEFFGNGFSKKN